MKCPLGDALDSVLRFTASEKEFFDKLLQYDGIVPSLLTDDEGRVERVGFSPLHSIKKDMDSN